METVYISPERPRSNPRGLARLWTPNLLRTLPAHPFVSTRFFASPVASELAFSSGNLRRIVATLASMSTYPPPSQPLGVDLLEATRPEVLPLMHPAPDLCLVLSSRE